MNSFHTISDRYLLRPGHRVRLCPDLVQLRTRSSASELRVQPVGKQKIEPSNPLGLTRDRPRAVTASCTVEDCGVASHCSITGQSAGLSSWTVTKPIGSPIYRKFPTLTSRYTIKFGCSRSSLRFGSTGTVVQCFAGSVYSGQGTQARLLGLATRSR